MGEIKLPDALGSMRREYHFSRQQYILELGETFHHKSAADLAKLSLNSDYTDFVNDYVNFVCSEVFKKEFEIERAKLSKLEQAAQAQGRQPPALRDAISRPNCGADTARIGASYK